MVMVMDTANGMADAAIKVGKLTEIYNLSKYLLCDTNEGPGSSLPGFYFMGLFDWLANDRFPFFGGSSTDVA